MVSVWLLVWVAWLLDVWRARRVDICVSEACRVVSSRRLSRTSSLPSPFFHLSFSIHSGLGLHLVSLANIFTVLPFRSLLQTTRNPPTEQHEKDGDQTSETRPRRRGRVALRFCTRCAWQLSFVRIAGDDDGNGNGHGRSDADGGRAWTADDEDERSGGGGGVGQCREDAWA